MTSRSVFLGVLLAALPVAAADDPDLRLQKGPGAGEVTLTWIGGVAPFDVYRGAGPVDVTNPGNHLGQTSASTWADTPPAGAFTCYVVRSATCTPAPEICDGIDNDCNPGTPDGMDDPLLGKPCDGGDSDLCDEGTFSCTGGSLVCGDATGNTLDLCNGIDDDCDPASADGSEDPAAGTACDGTDSDLCNEGTRLCSGGVLLCSDTTGNTLDLCNGVDDDCDPASADGAEDPSVGTACDGGDGDLCLEGTRSCSGGAIVCSDVTSTTIDLCNGIDDDCDPASADGSEDPGAGQACDGGDSDLCKEGVKICTAGSLLCGDTTGNTLDVCNGVDDDCDSSSADGSEDPGIGVACDGADGDLCIEGSTVCTAGSIACSDVTGTTVEVCNASDDDCDGTFNEGFTQNSDPTCASGAFLGTVSGDVGNNVLSAGSYAERWYRVTVREDSSAVDFLSAGVALTVPAGVDFDLYVYCVSCGGSLAGSSTIHGLGGHTETVTVRANDSITGDDTFDIRIEIRFFNASPNTCATWSLDVVGNVPATVTTCS